MPLPELTAAQLRSVLDYEPDTGIFRWKQKLAQRVHVGEAIGTIGPCGYLIVGIFGKRYRLNRLAVLWMTGKWPPEQVDHINRDVSDNRWNNLRLATNNQNQWNSAPNKTKKLPKGVTRDRAKYRARIAVNGKTIFIGHFPTISEASLAYAMAAKKYFGEYARTQ